MRGFLHALLVRWLIPLLLSVLKILPMLCETLSAGPFDSTITWTYRNPMDKTARVFLNVEWPLV